jgi:hypothetical protein
MLSRVRSTGTHTLRFPVHPSEIPTKFGSRISVQVSQPDQALASTFWLLLWMLLALSFNSADVSCPNGTTVFLTEKSGIGVCFGLRDGSEHENFHMVR